MRRLRGSKPRKDEQKYPSGSSVSLRSGQRKQTRPESPHAPDAECEPAGEPAPGTRTGTGVADPPLGHSVFPKQKVSFPRSQEVPISPAPDPSYRQMRERLRPCPHARSPPPRSPPMGAKRCRCLLGLMPGQIVHGSPVFFFRGVRLFQFSLQSAPSPSSLPPANPDRTLHEHPPRRFAAAFYR